MGCWNGTCALSGLYVNAGTPIYVFLMSPTKYHDRCYTSALFEPLIIPFEAKYNDYGAGEDCSGAALNPIVEAIQQHLVETEVGENEYHDIAVKKEGFNVDLMFEAIHENRLNVALRYFSNDPMSIDFAMVRKDVFELAAANYRFKRYVGDSKGTTGWDNNYIEHTFADIVASVPALFDRVANEMAELIGSGTSLSDIRVFHGFSSFCDFNSDNLAEQWGCAVSSGSHIHTPFYFDVDKKLVDLLRLGQRQEAEQLFQALLVGVMVDSLMSATRRVWLPAMHQGSQAAQHQGYRAINAAIEHCLNAYEKEVEQDNGEPFEDYC